MQLLVKIKNFHVQIFLPKLQTNMFNLSDKNYKKYYINLT